MRPRIVFCGTPEFAAQSLKKLLDNDCDIIAVVTMPDKEQGRGRKLAFSPVKKLALDYELPIFQPLKATDPMFLDQLETLAPDLILVCAYGKILRKRFIGIPKFGCVNLHASLLPQYRGPSPIQFAILNGDEETGVTTFMIDEGMDSGDIILEQRVPIATDDTTGSLHDKLAEAGAQLLYDTVKLFDHPPVKTRPQPDEKVFYTTKITPEMSVINWNACARSVSNLIRAMNPAPGARTSYRSQILKIFSAKPIETTHSGTPGQVLYVDPEHFTVACAEGQLHIREVQLEGKSRMPARLFLLGHRLDVGDYLGG
ncbi:MAG: methionyl-tRNA formyltransferase [Candidatus Auribacterota bacterium]|jgi:methionyl-tRNA formyltransferase|nr:methionyl-tRNA formyltransferase [Candidatus Auribacterota bacterium]